MRIVGVVAVMCGIHGVYLPGRGNDPQVKQACARAGAALAHRGPDDVGLWSDEDVALGQRRLAIIDPSPAGRQPMISADGRWVISFNGEMYNFPTFAQDLRQEGFAARGHSDTEVLVELIARHGPEVAVRKATGMLALAAWDRQERRLWLARDRFGKKPLYLAEVDGGLAFASELVGLRPFLAAPEVDRVAVAAFLHDGWFRGGTTIFRGVMQVRPGQILSIGPDGRSSIQYFDPIATAREAIRTKVHVEPAKRITDFLEVLDEAVRRRMVADVPLGAFLSGGIDSSLVVASMQRQSDRPVRTFTIGFEEAPFDEAAHARAVADELGTQHREHVVTAEEALAVIPKLPEIYGEPFADPSAIPTYLLSGMARRDVTVALSGDGGDEFFGGYRRYGAMLGMWRWARLLTPVGRRLVAASLGRTPPEAWNRILAGPSGGPSKPRNGMRLRAALKGLGEGPRGLYSAVMAAWPDGSPGGDPPPTQWPGGPLLDAMMLHDVAHYLPEDILVKIDRASMAHGLEVRAPLLDDDLYRFAWSVPRNQKQRRGVGKVLLRRALETVLPGTLATRPKQGFAVPIGSWLRGELKTWADELLTPQAIDASGVMDPEPVQRAWRAHSAGRDDRSVDLWPVLMFQQWFQHQGR